MAFRLRPRTPVLFVGDGFEPVALLGHDKFALGHLPLLVALRPGFHPSVGPVVFCRLGHLTPARLNRERSRELVPQLERAAHLGCRVSAELGLPLYRAGEPAAAGAHGQRTLGLRLPSTEIVENWLDRVQAGEGIESVERNHEGEPVIRRLRR